MFCGRNKNQLMYLSVRICTQAATLGNLRRRGVESPRRRRPKKTRRIKSPNMDRCLPEHGVRLTCNVKCVRPVHKVTRRGRRTSFLTKVAGDSPCKLTLLLPLGCCEDFSDMVLLRYFQTANSIISSTWRPRQPLCGMPLGLCAGVISSCRTRLALTKVAQAIRGHTHGDTGPPL